MRATDWDRVAEAGITALLQKEGAVVWPEVEAKLADVPSPSLGVSSINPHHLTNARRRMLEAGTLLQSFEKTRGGRMITTYHGARTSGRRTIATAARKRLLWARYLGWATGSRRHPEGLIGPALERVVHASLVEAAPAGYRLAERSKRGVEQLLGGPVEGGSLDDAAHVQVFENDVPIAHAVLPIESKNIREWIYPTSAELYQLLHKAAWLQLKNPSIGVVPVLVCRRLHYEAATMAKALGFYMIDTKRQFIVPTADIDDDELTEVREELGLRDLLKGDGSDRLVVAHLRKSLPQVLQRSAERWLLTATAGADVIRRIHQTKEPAMRSVHLAELRAATTTAGLDHW